ncbi:TPA: hypothetical protein L3760_005564 [Pseudomonas aeruginosa]|nr:hypothetical protein [Pseudomonas aeruginosa]HDQ9004762.1 hypothetical protein [Pseudomonas aeruginosa]HDQ9080984.1 hypothetical protein [Pseudomonas aeruginosa]HDQ9371885.1 hypothetical protein [Pseudomonas aeruginosa]HDQ9399522.1 hypothetical protein [Pseudomonas aeruginosa]
MEHHELPESSITEELLPDDQISGLEWVLLRRFRALSPKDQVVLFKMMEGLTALAALEN